MPRRSTLLPVLVAVAAAGLGMAAVPAPAQAVPVVSVAAIAGPAAALPGRRAEGDAPLSITIDELTPSSIPAKGKVRISGWVTNDSDETWSAINVHAFISNDPITNDGDLAFESTRGSEEFVGDRITVPGTFDTITELTPGASQPYTDRIPVSVLDAQEPGVYWFGVHALGTNAAGRDEVADGRARTFLPYVPRKDRGRPVDTALVLPIRHQVLYEPDGALADTDRWVETLGDGGQLSSILDFGIAAGNNPLTWLIDPAVPDAAGRLADGNQPRQLVEPEAQGADAGGGSESAAPSDGTSDGASATDEPQTAAPAGEDPAAAATLWLVKLQRAITGKQVLGLPWGDVDVAAAAEHGPDVYADARARTGGVLTVGQVPMTAAMAAPSGYLDDAALSLADAATTVLLSDRAVTRGQAPAVATYAGHRVIFASSHARDGGPGPDDPLAPVAMRQRILSEAALRLTQAGRPPLVVVFPPTWRPPTGPDYAAFFDGLDVNWMRLTSLADATASRTARELPADRFTYPAWQANHEVDAAAFASLDRLTDEATRLQDVLSVESDVASRIRGDAFGNVSYAAREDAVRSRVATLSTIGWVDARLQSITVSAPRRVILSSDSGPFSVNVTNGLDEPVSVRIHATSSPPMKITGPDRLELAANTSTSVLLQASTNKLGVHNVTIALTDPNGNPLGSSDELPVRAAAVSQVIWLIVGVAVLLLLIAIVTRVVRRIRGTGPSDDDDDAAPPPGEGPPDQEAAREPEPATPVG